MRADQGKRVWPFWRCKPGKAKTKEALSVIPSAPKAKRWLALPTPQPETAVGWVRAVGAWRGPKSPSRRLNRESHKARTEKPIPKTKLSLSERLLRFQVPSRKLPKHGELPNHLRLEPLDPFYFKGCKRIFLACFQLLFKSIQLPGTPGFLVT